MTSLTVEQGGGASITPFLQIPHRVTLPQQTHRHSGSGCCCSSLPSPCTTSLRGWLWASATPLQALHLLLLTKVPGNNQIPSRLIFFNTLTCTDFNHHIRIYINVYKPVYLFPTCSENVCERDGEGAYPLYTTTTDVKVLPPASVSHALQITLIRYTQQSYFFSQFTILIS